MLNVDWSKAVDSAYKKSVKEIGKRLDTEMKRAGILNHEDIRANMTKASRVVAVVFKASLGDLIRYSMEVEIEAIPNIEDLLREDDNEGDLQ